MSKKRDKDTEFELCFYEKILDEAPDFVEALIAIGDLYTRLGMIDKGLEVDQRLSCLRPDDGTVLYNLACSYALLGDIDKSFGAMKLALENGYDDLDYLKVDDHLEKLREDKRFQEYISRFRADKISPAKSR